ncbi:MAG: hypothetical protein JWM86_2120 [Thermoleophilia bacterium]|nr:hypothetical protein [Thermoleophilia bacterium]
MTWPMRTCVSALALVLAVPAIAAAHGAAGTQFRTKVLSITPEGLPVDVRMTKGDEIRFENVGDGVLELCGYETKGCTPWVRIGPTGVFMDRNSEAYFANRDGERQGAVPEDAGTGPSDFRRVRREPPFYAYHDHRVHWMGGSGLPPGVDEGDPSPQRVYDGEVRLRYDVTEGVVRTRLTYVGGRTWIARYGEYALTSGAVLAMLIAFVVDARRRRRAEHGDAAQDPAGSGS